MIRVVILSATLMFVLACDNALAETSIRSVEVQAILDHLWQSEFAAATDSCYRLVAREDANPVGYFLLGMVYYAISSQYRTDDYVDSVTWNLDAAIKLAKAKTEDPPQIAEAYFVLGSAYGCRALYRSMHGGWWGAFRDGHHSCVNLEKAYEGDTTLTDALSGIGAYHYWKSVKSKKVAWLPFISDKRTQGLNEIARAIAGGGMMVANARKALLPIYCYEKRFEEALKLADSLQADGLFDTNCQLHAIRALIEQKQWDEAGQSLDQVEANWEISAYADSCGFSELQYLRAQVLAGQGNEAGARELVKKLVSQESACRNSAYYRDTLAKAKTRFH